MEQRRPILEQCMVCGSKLAYRELPQPEHCHYCGGEGLALISCPEGHFVCDRCHGADLPEMLRALGPGIPGTAPEEILEELFSLPRLPLHGPENHPLAAMALLLAAHRAGRATDLPLEEAVRRALQVPGGACGYLGACGAAVSAGVAVSLLLEATPLKGYERGLANRAAAAALNAVGDGHPRCCKRGARQALAVGRQFLEEHLLLSLPWPARPVRCTQVERNRECIAEACPYHPENASC